jgi:membrane protein required for colicin V production
MTGIDLAAVVILIGSVFVGLLRGFAREVFAIAGLVAAFFLARQFGPALAIELPGPDDPRLQLGAAYVSIFIVTWLLLALVARLLGGALRLAGLGAHDRLLGAGFGLLRGVAMLTLLTLLAGLTALPHSEAWRTAWLRAPLETAARFSLPWLPADLAALIQYSPGASGSLRPALAALDGVPRN